ncbi:hypothetical protein I6E45_04245 [Clostridium perfringens]|uniref:hypothetical protein n=3 Tax=Clostridium perfringens TaxID=1502 RepID=UPI000166AB21|nr:hypothetical protein [Clostridium perfringens]AXH52115.1 hypothetical protein C8114_05690 [Clostridium perfringens]EDS80047.1 putative membrane protein [Clostridium perfringens C str. JGS1495]ELC8421256.1 hypothetical protein [Clostridium perfringens]MBI6028956.1 hypothetical protein [Clostridium perfringens]MBI6031993.1 hypothetical protein [Clostridium perfringens]
MRIIINEIKKLFNLKILLILGLIVFIICKIFISFWIEVFPNGSETPDFNLSVQMLKDYGTTMDEKEFEDFKEKSALREKEADEYLKGDKEAQELGIKSYRELRESLDKGKTDEKVEALHSKIYFKDNVYLFWEMQSRESLIASYENPLNRKAEVYSSKPNKYKRLKELEKGDQLKSVLSYVTFLNYDSLITNFSILVVVTLAFIISPIFLRDEKNKVNCLQYSSKTGRKIGSKKVISAMITAFGISTLELIVLFLMYIPNDTLQFWNCSINSKFNYMVSWFDLTFGQYIMLTILVIYIITFVVTSVSLFVSSKVKSYVALIGIQVPILGALIMFLDNIGLNHMTTINYPKYIPLIAYVVFIIISILLIINLLKNEKNRDVLN